MNFTKVHKSQMFIFERRRFLLLRYASHNIARSVLGSCGRRVDEPCESQGAPLLGGYAKAVGLLTARKHYAACHGEVTFYALRLYTDSLPCHHVEAAALSL